MPDLESSRVDPGYECPNCGESRPMWLDEAGVRETGDDTLCATCGKIFTPDYSKLVEITRANSPEKIALVVKAAELSGIQQTYFDRGLVDPKSLAKSLVEIWMNAVTEIEKLEEEEKCLKK